MYSVHRSVTYRLIGLPHTHSLRGEAKRGVNSYTCVCVCLCA